MYGWMAMLHWVSRRGISLGKSVSLSIGFMVYGLGVFYSIYSMLLMSCVMWSDALDSSCVILAYSITSLA